MVYTLLVVFIVLVSLLMIFIVLIQESKGGGLSSQFSSSNQIMGVRKTTDFVEKITWGLAAAMVVLSIFCAYTAPQAQHEQSVFDNQAVKTETTNPVNTQGFGAGQAPQGAQQGAPAQGTQQNAPAAPKLPATPAK
ncbi:preprotein translocase subunit SecG [Prevotella sp. KH2C16]|uniref:preprotein translocase subunit SecG n=1 Tax=Prevotella sp. KH2C16 TaxID=1855325 RepID=UPI0008F1BFB5|nr:preprotein translocase subunit SecG [Prevotella sp. KH2C16]SFG62997.1 preprotein translocase subunit SecG [Prevotella sp. KH2C16]